MDNIGLLRHTIKCYNAPNYYIYGTFGKKLTKELIESKIKQYPSFYKNTTRINNAKKQVGKYGFDCVGLIKAYYWGELDNIKYNASQDKSANGMYEAANEKGAIGSIPKIPGIIVHMSGHVGIYDGDQYVYECTVSSTTYRIVKTKLAGRGWKNWFKCPYINYSSTGENENTTEELKNETVLETVTVKVNSSLRIRTTPEIKSENIIGSYRNATVVNIYEKSGIWGRTEKGWISLEYTSTGIQTNTSSKYVLGKYKVDTKSGVNVRETPNGKKLKAYKNETVFDTYEIKDNWAKTPSGWVCLDYCQLIKKY